MTNNIFSAEASALCLKGVSLPPVATIEILANHTHSIAQNIIEKQEWFYNLRDLEPITHNAITGEASTWYDGSGLTSMECASILWNLSPNALSIPIRVSGLAVVTIKDLLYSRAISYLISALDECLLETFDAMMRHCEPPEGIEWEFIQAKEIKGWMDSYLRKLS
jgi:hypothetical protein